MLQPVVFAAESAKDEAQPGQNTARLLNMYAEGGENGVSIKSAPGLIEQIQLGFGQVEAMLSTHDGIYAAVGGNLVLWDGSSVSTLGSIPGGPATMATNGTQVGVVSGGDLHVLEGSSLTQSTGAVFSEIGSISIIDNFWIITQADGQLWAYALADATSFDALDFASAEYRPDNLRRVVTTSALAYLMGETSVEPWQITGEADLPFQRFASTSLEKGLRTAGEVALLDNTFMWVSDEGRAYRNHEFTPKIISTDPVAAAMEAHSGRVVPFQFRRHDCFTWRADGVPAWIFDPSTEKWFERSTGPQHGEWEVTATVQHQGKWYAGTNDGMLCTFGGYQDRGNVMRREAISQNLTQGGNRFTVDAVDMRVEGAGTVMFSWSKDGGRTFSNERQRTFGASYDDRLQFRGLGQFRQFCLKVAVSDNTDFAVHSASVEIS